MENLFHRALERPEGQRLSFLEEACGNDRKLVARVCRLLEADAFAEEALEKKMALALERAVGEKTGELPFERIGPYRLLEEIGRGGLATVYLAERDDEHFQKRVALKLVRRGLDTEDVLVRFRHERQILARFEHPNIARLIDGGSTVDGRPFFVMEHVLGEPIDVFCARRRLGLSRRLELFRSVCAAVAYAHQNLVIHRDLKPSNILVAEDGRPKLLDFGIAKLLDPEDAAAELHTEKGLLLLTPEYASPEQVEGRSPTTQTDVYSLGVTLYQLLTGILPYQIQRRSVNDVLRSVRDTEPPRPSTALFEAEDLRRAGLLDAPRKLRRRLRGDLDTILKKALCKEPRRRYPSVEQFSEDLRRYLEGERVLARPESFGYRAAKFVRRHRAIVSALAAAALLLVAVVGFYTAQLRSERDVARWQANKADRVSSLLVSMLEISDPGRNRGETITALELLERAADRLEIELADQPEMRSALMELIGSIYLNLGLYTEAAPLLEGALALRRDLYSPPHEELAEALEPLGELHYLTGAYQKADDVLRRVLSQRIDALGTAHPLVGKSLGDLAAVLQARGRHEEAESLYHRALQIQLTAGEDNRETLITQANFASLLFAAGKLDEAEVRARKTLEVQRSALGDAHPDVAVTENTLAATLIVSRQYASAEPLLKKVLRRQRELYGPEHPKVAASLTNLGAVHYYLDRYEEAEANYLEALEIQQKIPEGDKVQIISLLVNLAHIETHAKGDDSAAADLLARSLELRRQIYRSPHPKLSRGLILLGLAELRSGRKGLARSRLEEATGIMNALEEAPADQRTLIEKLRGGLESPRP